MTVPDKIATAAGRIFLTTCILTIAGCGASTSVTGAWQDPHPIALPFGHLLVVGISPSSRTRRSFEEETARLIGRTGSRATTGGQANISAQPTPEGVEEAARRVGADAVVVTRLITRRVALAEEPSRVGVKTQRPASLADQPGLLEFFSLDYKEVDEPGEVSAKSTAVLESNVFDVTNGGRLVYTMTTVTSFREDQDDVIADVSAAITTQLRREGLIR